MWITLLAVAALIVGQWAMREQARMEVEDELARRDRQARDLAAVRYPRIK